MGTAVKLSGVTRRFPVKNATGVIALSDIYLDFAPQTVVAVTGPSGSGKSTLLHIIGAMDLPNEGRVQVDGLEVTSLSGAVQAAYRRSIGFVFQNFHLLQALTLADNVAAPLLPYRTGFDKRRRAMDLLEAVGLEDRAASFPSNLSAGEQQRVAIARALVNDPGLLLADEPTGNLDSETSLDIMQLLLDLRNKRGMTVVVATHDPLIASRCDRVLRLQDGRVVEDVEIQHPPDAEGTLGRITGPGPGT